MKDLGQHLSTKPTFALGNFWLHGIIIESAEDITLFISLENELEHFYASCVVDWKQLNSILMTNPGLPYDLFVHITERMSNKGNYPCEIKLADWMPNRTVPEMGCNLKATLQKIDCPIGDGEPAYVFEINEVFVKQAA